MGVDRPGGPGKGPETTDPPTSPPERPSTPPAESGPKHSRLESHRLAREAQAQDNGTQQPQGKDSGTPPSEERDDKPDPADTGNGGAEAEKLGQAETGELGQGEDERDDEPGSETDQPKPGEAARPDDHDEDPPSQDNGNTPEDKSESSEQRPDPRTETADDLAPNEQQSTLPADTPQYPPGSRRESLARSRAEQMAVADELRAKFQDPPATSDAGEPGSSGRDDRDGPPQNENAGTDDPAQQAQPLDTDTPTDATDGADTPSVGDASSDGDGAGTRDQPAPATSEADAQPPAPETGRPQDQEHEPLLPQDSSNSGDNSGDPPAEPPTDGSPPADDQPQDGTNGTLPGSEVDEPTDPVTETGPAGPEPGREATSKGPETTDQGTEPPEPKADDRTTGDETDNPKPVDETTPPPDGTGENVTPPEAPGEQSDGHGRNAEEPQSIEPTDETNPPDHEAELSGEREGSGTEIAPHQEESTDVEPSRFAGHVTITLDRDGRPVPPDRPDADTETPGRGELRRPEDDPADRDYQEGAEKSSRKLDLTRQILKKSDDVKDSVDKIAEPAQKHLERVKPTGQSCAARNNPDHIKSVDAKVQVGDVTIGIIGTTILAIEVGRQSVRMARKITGRDNARN